MKAFESHVLNDLCTQNKLHLFAVYGGGNNDDTLLHIHFADAFAQCNQEVLSNFLGTRARNEKFKVRVHCYST